MTRIRTERNNLSQMKVLKKNRENNLGANQLCAHLSSHLSTMMIANKIILTAKIPSNLTLMPLSMTNNNKRII